MASLGVEPSPIEKDTRFANVPEVPDLHVAWEFDQDAWRAEFIAGPLQGTWRTLRVDDLDKKKWSLLREYNLVKPKYLCHAWARERKLAARSFLLQWAMGITKTEPDRWPCEFGALLDQKNAAQNDTDVEDSDMDEPSSAAEKPEED